MATNDLTFEIKVDSEQAQKALLMLQKQLLEMGKHVAKINGVLGDFGASQDQVAKAIDDLDDSLESVNEQLEGYVSTTGDATAAGDEFAKANTKAAKETDKADKAAQKSSGSVGKLGQAWTSTKANIVAVNQALQAASFVFSQIDQAIGSTVRAATSFEKGIAEIRTLVTDGSDANVDYAESILSLQQQFGGSQADIIKAFYDTISTGAASAASATQFFADVNKLSIGGVASLGESVGLVSGILENYEIATSDTSRVTDILFTVVQKGRTTIRELSSNFGEVAAVAANAGVSLEELGAAFATTTISVGNTSRSATSIRAAIVALLRPTEEMQKTYQALGISSIEATLRQDGLGKTIQRITQSVNGSQQALTKLFGSIESLSAVTAIGGSGAETFADSLKAIGEAAQSGGAVTETAFKKVADTGAFRLELVTANLQATITRLGQVLVTVLVPVLESLVPVFQRVANAARNFALFVQSTDWASLSGSIAALATVIGGALVASLASAAGGFKILAAQALASSKAMALALVPAIKFVAISAIVLAVAAAIEILVRNIDKLGTVFTAVFRSIAVTLTDIRARLTEAKLAIQEFFGATDAAENTRRQLVGVYQELGRIAEERDTAFGELDLGLTGAAFEGVKSILAGAMDDTKAFNSELDKVGDSAAKVTDAFEPIADSISDATNELGAFLDQLRSALIQEATAGLSQADQIKVQIALEREKLAVLEAQIVASGAMTEEQAKQLAKAQAGLDSLESVRLRGASFVTQEDAQFLESMQTKVEEMNKNREAFGRTQREQLEAAHQAEVDRLRLIEAQLLAQQAVADSMAEQTRLAEQAAEVGALASQAEAASPTAQMDVDAGVQALQGVFADLGPIGESMGTSIASSIGMEMTAAIGQMASVVGLILKAPELLNGLASFLKDLGSFPMRLVDAFLSVLSELGTVIPKFIESLIAAIPKIVEGLLQFLVEGLPALAQKIPELILNLINALIPQMPKIVQLFIETLITNVPRIIIALVVGIIENLPAIIVALGEALLNLIPALIEGVGEAFSGLFDPLTDAGDTIADGFDDVMESISTSSSSLFEVLDSAAEARGLDVASRIAKAIDGANNRTASIWERMMAALRATWEWVKMVFNDLIIKPLMEAWNIIITLLTAAWEGMMLILMTTWESIKIIWSAMVEALSVVFEWGVENLSILWETLKAVWMEIITLLKGLWDGVKLIFDGIISVFSGLWDGVKLMFQTFIIGPFKLLWNFVSTLFSDPIKAFKELWEGVKGLFSNFLSGLGGIWDKISGGLGKMLDGLGKIGETLWNFLKNVGSIFAEAAVKLWDNVKNLFSNLGGILANAAGALWEAVKRLFSGLGNVVGDALSGIGNALARIFSFDGGGTGTVENFLGIDFPWVAFNQGGVVERHHEVLKFANGGVVPGSAVMPGDHPRNDIVPAMLRPGQMIIPRSLASDPDLLAAIKSAGGVGSFNPSNNDGSVPAMLSPGEIVVPPSLERDRAFMNLFSEKMAGREVPHHILGFIRKEVAPAVVQAGDFIAETASQAWESATQFLESLGGEALNIYNWLMGLGAALPPLDRLTEDPVGALKDAFQSVAGDWFGKQLRGLIGFHQGGLIPDLPAVQYFATGGLVRGSDTVPAMLTPGEFVVNRYAVGSLGVDALKSINRGASPLQPGETTVQVNLTVNTTEPMDAKFIKQKLMPDLKRELQKESLRGSFIIAQNGLRGG